MGVQSIPETLCYPPSSNESLTGSIAVGEEQLNYLSTVLSYGSNWQRGWCGAHTSDRSRLDHRKNGE